MALISCCVSDKLRILYILQMLITYQVYTPLEPKDYFYNWLYINTLFLNNDLSEKIQEYDCFTDIEFNPQRSINCQAKAAAIFTGLAKAGVLKEALNDRKLFLKLVYNYEKTKEAKEPYSE